MAGQLDGAAKAAFELQGWEWPSRTRIFQLGGSQLFLVCEGRLGINARKMMGALDAEAQAAAVKLISGFTAGSGLPELAAVVPMVILLPPLSWSTYILLLLHANAPDSIDTALTLRRGRSAFT